MEMSAEPHFIDKLISYFGKKLFVIIMPFEALGGVQVGDIAVCWSILIGAGMGYNIFQPYCSRLNFALSLTTF